MKFRRHPEGLVTPSGRYLVAKEYDGCEPEPGEPGNSHYWIVWDTSEDDYPDGARDFPTQREARQRAEALERRQEPGSTQ